MERTLNLIREQLSNTFIDLLKSKVSVLYLVGGAIRDAYFGKPLKDFDFVVSVNDLGIVKRTLTDCKITNFSLNEGPFSLLRAVKDDCTFDFAILSGLLEEDMDKRDFTINSLYYDVKKDRIIFKPEFVKDLQDRVLRVVNSNSIINDPVRALRGIRLATYLSLYVEQGTNNEINRGITLLRNVPGERAREETKKILHSSFSDLLDVFESVFEKNLLDILPRVMLLDEMDMLDKEVNKDISFKDICKLSILSLHFKFFMTGFVGRERKYVHEILNLKVGNNFGSLFDAFFKHIREIRIPLCTIVISFEPESILKSYSLFEKWSRIKIDGRKIKGKVMTGREVGEKKKELLMAECKRIYDEV
jgi:tRNA nucleotidyltransferase/poly(A) polymerase